MKSENTRRLRTVYDENCMIANWREQATQTLDPSSRERLLRLADQLQQIVWTRGVFHDPDRKIKLSLRSE